MVYIPPRRCCCHDDILMQGLLDMPTWAFWAFCIVPFVAYDIYMLYLGARWLLS